MREDLFDSSRCLTLWYTGVLNTQLQSACKAHYNQQQYSKKQALCGTKSELTSTRLPRKHPKDKAGPKSRKIPKPHFPEWFSKNLQENGTDSSGSSEDMVQARSLKSLRCSITGIKRIRFLTPSGIPRRRKQKLSDEGVMELKRNPDSLDPMFNYGSSSAGSAALDETSSEAITLSTAGDHTHKLN